MSLLRAATAHANEFPALAQQALRHVQEPLAAALDCGRIALADANVVATAHLLAGLKALLPLRINSDALPTPSAQLSSQRFAVPAAFRRPPSILLHAV